MADVTYSGVATPDKKPTVRIAGGTIAKHDLVYVDTSDSNKVKAADNDAEATAVLYGMALHAASSGEYVLVATNGMTVTVGGGLTAKTEYYASGTAGATAPIADVTSGKYISRIGFATATTALKIDINNSGLTT
jgi:hypothetical protein